MNVEEIESGMVVDHIKAGKGRRVLELLKIGEDFESRIALVSNVPSKTMGKKDIVKIEGMSVSDKLANLIALVAPGSTINIIKNKKVEKKYTVSLPKELKGAGVCPNPNCITNMEHAEPQFRQEGSSYRCAYCERMSKPDELVK
jgi:aspartate carbamoyltransferase regulatory subunit